MASTPKKRSKKSKVTRSASRVESLSQLKKTIATLEKTIASQVQEIRDGAEQQTATSEVLRVIASSPTRISNPCWTWLSKMPRGCVMQATL
jgi:hypothetical protein